MSLEPFPLWHTYQQQVRIALQPFTGNQKQLARRQHILLLTSENRVAKVKERDAQLAVWDIYYYRHIRLQPVALPGVALFHTQRSNIIDVV